MVVNLAVIGTPISHSLSPRIHRAAYQTLNLDWYYQAIDVSVSELEWFLETHNQYLGLSVTMPLKERLFEISAEKGWQLDSASMALSAANTVFNDESGTQVFNTDVFGARQALSALQNEGLASIAVVGSGATARSTVFAAIKELDDVEQVTIFSRSRERAKFVMEVIESLNSEVEIAWLPLEAAADFGGAGLTINTLPSEVSKQIEVDRPLSGGWIFDANYAQTSGSFTEAWPSENRISGLEMLLWQAIAQIRIFTGHRPDVPLENEGTILASMRAALL